jgi:hypothetical protein
MTDGNPDLLRLLELANHYPSPHNGQPIQITEQDDAHFTLGFQRDRGLRAVEVSYLFSYVTMGVFVYHLELCAKALGHKLEYSLSLPALEQMKRDGAVPYATCTIEYNVLPADASLEKTLHFRQTSRKKYFAGTDDSLSEHMIDIAESKHLQLIKMNRQDSHQAIWLNQRAVFDDMFDEPVRAELERWLRFDKKSKISKKDGLAYDCMELNGRVMKFIMHHHKILRLPGISQLLKNYYLRTMSDESDVYYLLAPFSTEKESYDVGVTLMQIWESVAASGHYLHPFGTIMSNEAAHADFLKLAGIEHEDRRTNFLVFIYRCGKSETPHSSMRIPVDQHLLRRDNV